MFFLRELRERAGLTLRQVEEITGISNAYLSQLETAKIKKPSSQVIYKLAKLYGQSCEDLMIQCGLLKPIVLQPIELKQSLQQQINNLEERVKKLEKINSITLPLF